MVPCCSRTVITADGQPTNGRVPFFLSTSSHGLQRRFHPRANGSASYLTMVVRRMSSATMCCSRQPKDIFQCSTSTSRALSVHWLKRKLWRLELYYVEEQHPDLLGCQPRWIVLNLNPISFVIRFSARVEQENPATASCHCCRRKAKSFMQNAKCITCVTCITRTSFFLGPSIGINQCHAMSTEKHGHPSTTQRPEIADRQNQNFLIDYRSCKTPRNTNSL